MPDRVEAGLALADTGGQIDQRMTGWRMVFMAFAVASVAVALGAETPEAMLVRNWTTREGLPHDHVRAIARTRDGFLWLGTDSGLSRFDGREFRNFGLREGLGSVSVFSLLESRDGTLWVGTLGGGISEIRKGRVHRTHGREDGLPGLTATSLAEDAMGRIWASGHDGLTCLESGRWRAVEGSENEGTLHLRALTSGPDGEMWAVFPTSEVRIWKNGRWSGDSGGGPRQASAFLRDSRDRLWVAGLDRRLWCREQGKWTSIEQSGLVRGAVTSMAEAPDGTLWIIVHRSGFVGLRNGGWIHPEAKGWQAADSLATVTLDPDGRIWLGSSVGGLYLLTEAYLRIGLVDGVDEIRAANFIGCLIESRPGELMVGTQGRGLYQIRDGAVVPLSDESASDDSVFINALLKTRDGAVWAASSNGVTSYRHGVRESINGKSRELHNAWELLEDVDSGVWVGTGSGRLYLVRDGQVTRVDYGNSATPIKGMAQQEDGTLWVGTRGNGLFRGRKGKWERFGKESGLGSEIVRVVRTGPGGEPWVGTMGGGLAVWIGDGFRQITTGEGLPDDTVSQLYFGDHGELWLGTNRGLAVFPAADVDSIRNGEGRRFFPRIIDRFDGLVSEEFTISPPVLTSAGRLVFATTRGFVELDPDDFQANEPPPSVYIEGVSSNGRSVDAVNGRVELGPGVERVEIRFSAPHFGAPQRLAFRNRLSDVEQDWGEQSGSTLAEYRHLSPGSYRFEVEATSGNGKWSARPAVIDLVLRPHFWQTAWFHGAAAAVVLAGLAFAVRVRERKRAKARIQLLQRRQEVDTERARIARDLHDDVGAGLTQVALLSELAKRNLTKRPERAEQQIEDIFGTAKQLTRALDEIVWAVNPEQDTLEGFALFLGTTVQKFSQLASLRSRINVQEPLPLLKLDPAVRHHVYLAAKELLHNAVKHSGASEIGMEMTVHGDILLLAISDDGQGIDPQNRPGEDGLNNLRHRMAQVGGTCQVSSKSGEGTRVEMRIPMNTARDPEKSE
jgi:signal transduction histidine kinase/ligand-binding sensor domain-containing protein